MKIPCLAQAPRRGRRQLLRTAGCVAALAPLLALLACSADFALQAPAGEPMTVSDLGTHSLRNVGPEDATYRRVAAWAQANRTGWTQYQGTPPAAGTMVSYGGVSLQFVDQMVLTRAPAGIFEKTVPGGAEALVK